MKNKFTKGVNDNVIVVTEQCNNNCIMCCQPPKHIDDVDSLFKLNWNTIDKSDEDVDYVTISGGEPTLVGERLFDYIEQIHTQMPCAHIHILSNGRLFAENKFASDFYLRVQHKNISFGIPLHADNPVDHDRIAGVRGAFRDSLKGIQNLGLLNFEIEIRIVLLKQNIHRLPQIAEFISLNMPFVSQVSFMGLELVGHAMKNCTKVWPDESYYEELEKSIEVLKSCFIAPRIFNLPLCVLPKTLWPYAVKSISKWKKTNIKACSQCAIYDKCCGIFSTSYVNMYNIHPIPLSD